MVVLLLLLPFTVNNFIQGRFVLGLATSAAAIASFVNVWYGICGEYRLWLNTYLVTPAGAITVFYTMYTLSSVGSYWPFMLIAAYYFVLPERRAWIVNVATIVLLVPLAWSVLDQASAIRFSAVAVALSLFAAISMREINKLYGLLKMQAVTDELTGLYNRFLLENSLNQAIARNTRQATPMTLIVFDIDQFKPINDSLGHDVGDTVMKALGGHVKARIRAGDMAFRLGGDEFLILLNDTDESAGVAIAEDLRRSVEQADLLKHRKITISAGVSGLTPGMKSPAWIKATDQNLYRAKAGGRNRVVSNSDSGEG